MHNIMIDLETMDTRPTAAIVAIGAVAFDPATGRVDTENGFYSAVDLQSALDAGLTVNGSTISWWLNQSDDARKGVTTFPRHINGVLLELSRWIHDYECATYPVEAEVDVWGNGADFDNVILTNAYHSLHLVLPWDKYHNRCYRTLKKMFPDIKIQRTGTHHNALDDAIRQAEHAVRLMQHLTNIKRLGYLEEEAKQS